MLTDVKGIFFDLDGCIYRGRTPIPGVRETIAYLKSRNLKIIYLTNNASRSQKEYVEHFKSMGLDAVESEFYTSGMATVEYMYKKYGTNHKVYVVGGSALKSLFKEKGFIVVDDEHAREADFVVSCFDPEFNFKRLEAACYAIQYGAKFIATNLDMVLPVEDGYRPGAGAMAAAITAATKVKPFLIGKPSKIIVEMALKYSGLRKNEVVIVGDKVETDIIAAKRAGIKSILVLTGVTSKADLDKVPKKYYPDIVLESVNDMVKLF
ncbi:MAG: HAD-IIA family hydrolase [Nitrososphaeria archaeon]|nr:HAD-IIA family hydrolase [Nitrososphaeria archaeon]